LQIAEIVRMIVSHLEPTADARELAALARTCMIFHGPALDSLWRHQRTIVNLIKCMPDDLWSVETIRG
ncbi:hypothetical protein B0H13DRAFT_1565214, partial [Mycena leptocephala]